MTSPSMAAIIMNRSMNGTTVSNIRLLSKLITMSISNSTRASFETSDFCSPLRRLIMRLKEGEIGSSSLAAIRMQIVPSCTRSGMVLFCWDSRAKKESAMALAINSVSTL